MADSVFLDTPILNTIKAMLGRPAEDDAFDVELIVFIDAAISNLNELGVGPEGGLMIDVNTMWSDLLGSNPNLNHVKTYVYLNVKILFDAAGMSQHVLSAYEKKMEEQAWRITTASDPMIPQVLPSTEPEEV